MEHVGYVQPQAYRGSPVEVPYVLMQRTGKLRAEGESDFWGSMGGTGSGGLAELRLGLVDCGEVGRCDCGVIFGMTKVSVW